MTPGKRQFSESTDTDESYRIFACSRIAKPNPCAGQRQKLHADTFFKGIAQLTCLHFFKAAELVSIVTVMHSMSARNEIPRGWSIAEVRPSVLHRIFDWQEHQLTQYDIFGYYFRINAFLDHVNVADAIVCGNLEAYSCAFPTVSDRRKLVVSTGLGHQSCCTCDQEMFVQ